MFDWRSKFTESSFSSEAIEKTHVLETLASGGKKVIEHLVGSGKRVEVNEAFVGDKLDLLREFLMIAGDLTLNQPLS